MGFNFGVLPTVLFKPKEAFKSLGSQTIKEGAILAAVFAVVSSAITGVLGGQMNVVFWVISAVMGAVSVVATGWLAAQMAKAVFKGSGNVPNTVGYLAYGQVLGVVSSIVFAVLGMLGLGAMAGAVSAANVGAMMGTAGLIGIVGLVIVLWGLYISGAAVGTANGIRVLFGAICALVAGIIVGIVVGMIFGIIFATLGLGAMMGAGAAAAGALG